MSTIAKAAEALSSKWSEADNSEAVTEEPVEANPAPAELEPLPLQEEPTEPDSGERLAESEETSDTVYLSDALEHLGLTPDEMRQVVQIDGEPVEVSVAEVLAGYSREADYRRKTAALADERRQLEEYRQQELGQAPTAYMLLEQQKAQLQQRQQSDIADLTSRYDQALAVAQRDGDDIGFLKLRGEKDEQLRAYNQRAAMEYYQVEQQGQQLEQYVSSAAAAQAEKCDITLRNTIPNCHTPEALSQWKATNLKYASEVTGEPEAQLSQSLLKPEVWVLVDKARRYDAAQSGIQAARKPGPTLKGGSRKSSGELELRSNRHKEQELAKRSRTAKNSMDSMQAATERLSNRFAQSERGRRRRGLS